MPRPGLTTAGIVAAAAEIADEVGFDNLSLGLVAGRLGIRPPSLYKHIGGLADLQHRVAALAMSELGDLAGDAVAGRAGRDALTALAYAIRGYILEHPGRYAATIGAEFTGPGDPLLAASTRAMRLLAAVLRGYGISETEMDHAIRALRCTLHGYAVLQVSNAFQWTGDPDESFAKLIAFTDRGLRGWPPG